MNAPRWTSWNGNVTHEFRNYLSPSTEGEIAEAVARSRTVRAVGRGFSSADIVAGTESLIDLTTTYRGVVDVDTAALRVTVESGMILADLVAVLAQHDWCLPSLPDIDSVSVGGALATGTHGTGRAAHLLSGSVVSFRVVQADGSVLEVSGADPLMGAVGLALGTLGVISTVTFQAEPAFELDVVGEPVPDATWQARLPSWLASHEFLRILWLPHAGHAYVYRGDRTRPGVTPTPMPAPPFTRYRRGTSAALYRATTRFPSATPWVNQSLSRMFFSHRTSVRGSLYEATVTKSRSSTMELAEWSVGLDAFPDTFGELSRALSSRSNPAYAHIPMDIRFLRRDDTWLSYAYGTDAVTVGCVCRVAEAAGRYAAFDLMQRVFTAHGGRPHWAKRHSWGPDQCSAAWPRFEDFCRLREQLDPTGKFLDPYLAELLTTPTPRDLLRIPLPRPSELSEERAASAPKVMH